MLPRERGITSVGGRAIFPDKLHGGRASSKKVRQEQKQTRTALQKEMAGRVRKIESVRSGTEENERSPVASVEKNNVWHTKTWVEHSSFI